MSFQVPQGYKITFEQLKSVSVDSWQKTYTWTVATVLNVASDQEKAKIMAIFPTAKDLDFRHRKLISEYTFWAATQKEQTPERMAVDRAFAQGHEVAYETSQATVKGPTPVIVPASRVPLPQPMLRQAPNGTRGVRIGSDILAASIASMTKWTGKEVSLSMPLESMEKFAFKYARPSQFKLFLASIPSGPSGSGLKGRSWAFFLMEHFQNMPTLAYAQFMSDWTEAIFHLPAPHKDQRLDAVFKDNVKLGESNGSVFYRLEYNNPAKLASFTQAYAFHEQYEEMARQLVEFAAVRQGDACGVSMLAQSGASWGLVSKTQAEIEQAVSVIVGAGVEKAVLSGFSRGELERIRASVRRWSEKTVIYEKVEPYQVRDTKNQVATTGGAFHLIRGKTIIDTSLKVTKIGKVRLYSDEDALSKMWSHVEIACADENVVYYAAGLSPLTNTAINIFPAAGAWASVFFFSKKAVLVKASITKDGLVRENVSPVPPKEVHNNIIRGMNNAIAFWICPPINKTFKYSSLLAPLKSTKKQLVTFDPDSDDFTVTYVDDAIVDPEDANVQDSAKKDDAVAEEGGDEDQGGAQPGFVPSLDNIED